MIPTQQCRSSSPAECAGDIGAALRARFPVDELNKARRELDPRNILSNTLLDGLLAELG